MESVNFTCGRMRYEDKNKCLKGVEKSGDKCKHHQEIDEYFKVIVDFEDRMRIYKRVILHNSWSRMVAAEVVAYLKEFHRSHDSDEENEMVWWMDKVAIEADKRHCWMLDLVSGRQCTNDKIDREYCAKHRLQNYILVTCYHSAWFDFKGLVSLSTRNFMEYVCRKQYHYICGYSEDGDDRHFHRMGEVYEQIREDPYPEENYADLRNHFFAGGELALRNLRISMKKDILSRVCFYIICFFNVLVRARELREAESWRDFNNWLQEQEEAEEADNEASEASGMDAGENDDLV